MPESWYATAISEVEALLGRQRNPTPHAVMTAISAAVQPLIGVSLIMTACARTPAQLSRTEREILYRLPPYTAASLTRVIHRCGAMTREERDALTREAQLAGHDGELRPWGHHTRRLQRSQWAAD